MNDVHLGDLIVRMLISLVIVLGLILVAYAIVKRRRNGPPMRIGNKPTLRSVLGGVAKPKGATTGSLSAASTTVSSRRAPRSGSTKRGLQSVGRIGLSRTSSVVAVQFAERVYLLGTSEATSPNIIADVSLEEWEKSLEIPTEMVVGPSTGTGIGGVAKGAGIPVEGDGRAKLLDALREATTRRG